jgi:lipopolysaccharide/colanic/teichoic acid biosynthesis glycosyltransferase
LYPSYFKRIFDLALTVILLLVFSWLVVVIVLLYVLTFNFPILFVQARTGRGNRPFRMYKFRTLLTKEAPSDQRRFWLGDALRFLSLDELPQLWNVLKGDMSLVGPRPLPVEYLPLYSQDQLKRHRVRPGLTGPAQVNGRHTLSWEQKFAYDLEYVDNVSFFGDLKILFQTFLLLLSMRPDVSLKEEPFRGSGRTGG